MPSIYYFTHKIYFSVTVFTGDDVVLFLLSENKDSLAIVNLVKIIFKIFKRYFRNNLFL